MAMAVAGVSDPYCRSRPRLEAARRMPWPSSETAQARTPDIARTGTITRRRGTLPSWNGRGVGRNWGIPRYPLEYGRRAGRRPVRESPLDEMDHARKAARA